MRIQAEALRKGDVIQPHGGECLTDAERKAIPGQREYVRVKLRYPSGATTFRYFEQVRQPIEIRRSA